MTEAAERRAGAEARGVIWISGYSASGKTTVGRKVEARLGQLGARALFLDGDDLRSILAGRWGYTREERVELAHVYFRLASHLASQGHAVVVSAVAMFDEVRAWLDANVPGALEVYLDVPEAERLRRDAETKQLYGRIAGSAPGYDPPGPGALRVANHGAPPEAAAERIVAAFLAQGRGPADYGRDRHWAGFYAAQAAPQEPSPYARAVAAGLAPGTRLLEVGCGNGRDAAFFAREGHAVTALDRSAAAVEAARSAAGGAARFLAGTLPEVAGELGGPFDAAYSRFVIHAMPREEEERLLDALQGLLRPGGRLFLECRSIHDPLSRMGEVLSPTERIHGHYRRFIVLDELRERLLARGFAIEEQQEARGLAVHGDDDPVVIRVTARRATP